MDLQEKPPAVADELPAELPRDVGKPDLAGREVRLELI